MQVALSPKELRYEQRGPSITVEAPQLQARRASRLARPCYLKQSLDVSQHDMKHVSDFFSVPVSVPVCEREERDGPLPLQKR
jgi:hypothetical protein